MPAIILSRVRSVATDHEPGAAKAVAAVLASRGGSEPLDEPLRLRLEGVVAARVAELPASVLERIERCVFRPFDTGLTDQSVISLLTGAPHMEHLQIYGAQSEQVGAATLDALRAHGVMWARGTFNTYSMFTDDAVAEMTTQNRTKARRKKGLGMKWHQLGAPPYSVEVEVVEQRPRSARLAGKALSGPASRMRRVGLSIFASLTTALRIGLDALLEEWGEFKTSRFDWVGTGARPHVSVSVVSVRGRRRPQFGPPRAVAFEGHGAPFATVHTSLAELAWPLTPTSQFGMQATALLRVQVVYK
jgi:hypothetical protein